MDRKLEVCCTTWHVAHYWDLFHALKDHANFTLIDNAARSWRDPRFLASRPIPEGTKFAPFYEKGKYDFALLGLDQQALQPELGKSRVYRELNDTIQDIPKVVINHGSPVFPEYLKHEDMTDEDAKVECRRLTKALVGDNVMVVNSHTAAKDWGWGIPIWHGMDPHEWDTGVVKEPRAISALSPGGLDVYYNRQCMNELFSHLEERGIFLQWARVTKHAETGDKVENYKEWLGRGLIYVDVSIETPMNRARTEAMLSGCCVVQVEGAHDLDEYVNPPGKEDKLRDYMVIVPNSPAKIADKVAELMADPKQCQIIGNLGREMAIKTFSRERYKNDWLKLIRENLNIPV